MLEVRKSDREKLLFWILSGSAVSTISSRGRNLSPLRLTSFPLPYVSPPSLLWSFGFSGDLIVVGELLIYLISYFQTAHDRRPPRPLSIYSFYSCKYKKGPTDKTLCLNTERDYEALQLVYQFPLHCA